jgi:signal transduction histidine kinase
MVADTGMGIRLQDQTRVFELFEQSDQSAERAFEGTGLGLR